MADSYRLQVPSGAAFFRFNQTDITLGAGEFIRHHVAFGRLARQ
jgi:hypothetical protein